MATECSEQITLWKIDKQEVTVTFDGGAIVSDAGLTAMRDFERQLGILADLAQRQPDSDNPAAAASATGTIRDFLRRCD